MDREEIIRMAREAGAAIGASARCQWLVAHEELERFATLVAAAEREACAEICEDYQELAELIGVVFADRIRARGAK